MAHDDAAQEDEDAQETPWTYEATDVTTHEVFTGTVQATDWLNAVSRASHDPALPKGRGYSVRVREVPRQTEARARQERP